MKSSTALALALGLALAACGEPEQRGGLSPDEQQQLENAARMLDDNSALDTSGGPETTANAQ
ncbi:MAG: hypothetical protein AB7O91_00655 [Sphingomonas sp.]